jgi:hypothetical protein
MSVVTNEQYINFIRLLSIISYTKDTTTFVDISVHGVLDNDLNEDVKLEINISELTPLNELVIKAMKQNDTFRIIMEIFISGVSDTRLQITNSQSGGMPIGGYVFMAFLLLVNFTAAMRMAPTQARPPNPKSNSQLTVIPTTAPTYEKPNLNTIIKVITNHRQGELVKGKQNLAEKQNGIDKFAELIRKNSEKLGLVSEGLGAIGDLDGLPPELSTGISICDKIINGSLIIFDEMSFLDRVKSTLELFGIKTSIKSVILSNIPFGSQVSLLNYSMKQIVKEVKGLKKTLKERGISDTIATSAVEALLIGDPHRLHDLLEGGKSKKIITTIRRRIKKNRRTRRNKSYRK